MIFDYADIFEDDPKDPTMVLLKIPPGIADDWTEGDEIEYEMQDGKLILRKLEA